MASAPKLLAGTAVAVSESAALICGASGAGKSDLALRCISLAPGPLRSRSALLVADDQVLAFAEPDGIWLQAPHTIAGKLEVRGLGIVGVPHVPRARLLLVIELVERAAVPRLPDPPAEAEIAGHKLPLLRLAPFEASAPLKLLLALDQLRAGGATG